MKTPTFLLSLVLLSATAYSQTYKTVVSAPEAVSMTVFAGFADSTGVVEPVGRKAAAGIVTYFYELAPGNYHFVSSGYDYLSLNKNFVIRDKGLKLDANPGLRSEKGYTPAWMTYAYTDEVNANGLTTNALARAYPKVLSTPGFNQGKPVGEHTTQREMEAFLNKLDKANENMYTFVAGYSTLGRKVPLAVFTTSNLDGLSLEEAGAAVAANGKPTIFLHAEIHGNENSPGEAALGMCAELCGAYGEKTLQNANVIVMPRVNCDGTKEWTRGTSVAPDMNRDNLLVKNPEMKATHRVYNAFCPAVVIDMHEYGVVKNYSKTEGFLDDAGITVGGNQNNSKVLNELQKDMMRYVEKTGLESGLRFWEYTQAGYSDQSALHASHYYALRSSANFLVETPNSRSEKRSSFARRVFTHFFAVRALIQYSIENTETLMVACKADREHVITSREPFILRHGQNEEAYSYNRTIFSFVDGHAIKDTVFSVRYYEVPLITRPRPEAYVISKDIKNISRILEIASYNGIVYEELPAGTSMVLRQYSQNPGSEICELLDPKESVFENGAYIFRTAQPSAIVLMFLMEPDVVKTDRYPITLVQEGLLSLGDIFRAEK